MNHQHIACCLTTLKEYWVSSYLQQSLSCIFSSQSVTSQALHPSNVSLVCPRASFLLFVISVGCHSTSFVSFPFVACPKPLNHVPLARSLYYKVSTLAIAHVFAFFFFYTGYWVVLLNTGPYIVLNTLFSKVLIFCLM